MDTLATLKTRRQARFEEFKKDLNVSKLTKDVCQLTDQQLLLAWQESGLEQYAALIAVGGFGRERNRPKNEVVVSRDLRTLIHECGL